MDPLMVASRVGECIDAVLIEGNPLGDTEFFTDGIDGLCDGCNDSHFSPFLVRLDRGRRISIEADPTRTRPPMTKAVLSSTKPDTAVDNPA